MRKTAKLYLRLSKDKKDQLSLSGQERKGREYAHTLDVLDEDITVFAEDPGTSGYDEDVDLPERDKFIEHPADIAIVWMHDRLSRRGIEDSFRAKRLMQEMGTRYVAIADGIDTQLEGHEINLAVRALMANQYSQSLSKNVRRGKEDAAALGKWGGGPRWYGYQADPDRIFRGPKFIDEAEAKILHEIRERFVDGEPFAAIARDLNKRSITTVNGHVWRAENMLRLILKKRYVGIRVHNEIEYPGAWPAIFTTAQYVELQAAATAADRMKTWPTRPSGRISNLLTGFLECGGCGTRMRAGVRTTRENKQRRYRCHGCHKMQRVADPLDYLVESAVLFRLDTPELGALLQKSDADDNKIAELVDIHQAHVNKLDSLVDDYTDGILDRAQFTRAKLRAETALRTAETALQREVAKRTNIHLDVGQTLREWWDAAPLLKRRKLLGLVIEKIIVKPSNASSLAKADYYMGRWKFRVEDIEIIWTC